MDIIIWKYYNLGDYKKVLALYEDYKISARNNIVSLYFAEQKCKNYNKIICKECNINPIYIHMSDELCVLCDKTHIDEYIKQCKNNNEVYINDSYEYINNTNNNYKLIGYDNFTEYWLCLQCNYCITFEILVPSIQRDNIHCIGRENHRMFICDSIKTGMISYG